MDFISIVKEKATELAVGAAKVSNSAVKQVKSNIELADKEQEKTAALKELGKIMYDAYKAGNEPDTDAVAEKCVAVDNIENEIEEIKQSIKDIKNLKTCPACGADVKSEHNFCPVCGAKLG